MYVIAVSNNNAKQNTPGVQKNKAKLEAPVSYLFMQSTKKFDISDGGQGLNSLQEYHISMVSK